MNIHRLQVSQTESKTRLDTWLTRQLPQLSRAQIQSLMAEKMVKVNGTSVKPSYAIRAGDTVELTIPAPKPSHLVAQDIELNIVYEDNDIIVVNKPAGLVVHPGAGNASGTLVNALLHRFPDIHVGNAHRPGIVHRLDKDTSGLMVIARNDNAHHLLTQAFKAREVEKVYLAFCFGTFNQNAFVFQTGHRRHETNRKRFTTKLKPPSPEDAKKGIRLAISEVKVLASAGGVSEVEVRILTGRTHQIRSHFSDVGHALIADELYGGVKVISQLKPSPVLDAVKHLTRQALHAHKLAFLHPITREPMMFVAPLPPDLASLHEAMM